MNRWLVRGAIAWVLGYACALLLPGLEHASIIWFAAIASTSAAAAIYLPRKPVSLFCALLVIAAGYYSWCDRHNDSSVWRVAGKPYAGDGPTVHVEGVIASPVTVDGDRASFLLRLEQMRTEGGGDSSAVRETVKVNVTLTQRSDQAAAAAWGRADTIRLDGVLQLPQEARNVDGFDYRRYLRLHRIHALLSVKGIGSVYVAPPAGWGALRVLHLFDLVRERLSELTVSLFPGDQAGYMKGLLIGISDDMNPEQYTQFTDLGLTHLLAISGMHVAVLIAVLLWLGRRLGFTRETAVSVTIWALPVYIVLTGASPSVVRAGLMGMAGLVLLRKGLMHSALDLVCGVGWAMLIWNPYYLLDVSFQLSFAVTIGLILAMPPVNRLLPGRVRWLEASIALTFVAQIVSFPLSIYYFNQFSLLSWLANLLLVPLISFIVTPAGGAALLTAVVWPKAGQLLAVPVGWLNQATFALTEAFASWRGPVTIWPSPPLWWLIVYYVSIGALLYWADRLAERRRMAREGIWLTPPSLRNWSREWKGRLAAAGIASGLAFIAYGYSPDMLGTTGRIEFIDVGQGDAIYIRSPQNRHLLVDGGGTVTFRKPGDDWRERRDPYEVGAKLLVPLLKKRGVHRLDLVVATHEDADHIGGLQAVVEQLPVRRMLFNGTLKDSTGARKLLGSALDRRIPLVAASYGSRIPIDRFTYLDILYPSTGQRLGIASDQNARSVVLLLTMYDKRILLTGDMEAPTERAVLELLTGDSAGADASGESAASPASPLQLPHFSQGIDVLKVAHHGSKTSTTEQWLSFWQPRLAVISVGARNSYGHPSKPVTDRLSAHGIPMLRTDRDGEVLMEVTPGQLRVRTKVQADSKPTVRQMLSGK